jgi:hypothetical protein
MRMRAKVTTAVAAVLALLAPASAAQAAPSYDLTIGVEQPTVFPYVDGYVDSTRIDGEVSIGGAIERIRGSVAVSIGGRVVKTFPLSSTGQFHLEWNGKAANGQLVPGTAIVTLRVGDETTTDSVVVSSKKLVKITKVTSQTPWISYRCHDEKVVHTVEQEIAQTNKVCPMPRDAAQNILRITLRGSVSTGAVTFEGNQDATDYAVEKAVYPPVTTITAKFTQSGSGSNAFYLCEDNLCSAPIDSTLQTFSHSGTYATSGTSNYPPYPTWRVVVPHGHDLSFSKFTIKTVYWVLR